MSKKQSLLLCYSLVVSIVVVLAGFLGLGVRAFASAGISSTIFLVLLGILITVAPIYFVLRRPVSDAARRPKIFRCTPQKALWPGDRRGPFLPGHAPAEFAVERRGKKNDTGLLAVGQKSVGSETSHG